jgi:hypothetical protein
MRREPSLTFEGALRILGQHEHKTIERIDKLLGGVILGGGVVAGAVAFGVTPLAPLAAFGVMWGWVDQKGLAVDLLKSAIDTVSGRLTGLRGFERRDLIAAAHSTIAAAAVFESLREHVGQEFYAQLNITDEEKISLIRETEPDGNHEGIRHLYSAEIPAPSAAVGFEENAAQVEKWQARYVLSVYHFLQGLTLGENAPIDLDVILTSAEKRYRSRYLELAAKVPEFAIWAQLGEHAATRTAVREAGKEMTGGIEGLGVSVLKLNADVVTGFNANRDALNRIEALLAACAPRTGGGHEATAVGRQRVGLPGLLQAVSRANAGVLEERIIEADRERYPAGLEIPRVSEIYVNPRYRATVFHDQARPADEQWWEEQESRSDFDVFLARHVTAPDATRRPLLLLGHPGAGKSLLTKLFAARLPASQYMVVRVPLRRVSADAEIHHQIEEALDTTTHQRITWSDLAEQSGEVVRVVLLDGLDELLQASGHDRSRFLEDVMDFQERESTQKRPVVAVVTSRTVVADRVRVPDGTTVVKLDPFTGNDITDWLGRWKRANADAIAAGIVGELTLSAVRRQPELAEQPLLLLMLALYAADPDLPPLGEDMATAELYRRLLDGFARREAGKDVGLGRDPSPDELAQRARDHLDRLAVAALGMFNRGRQDISEEELGRDLEALEPRLMERSRPAEEGQRIIGEFFFVHAPEARTTDGQRARGGRPQRAYEYLHATFGEYQVARRVMDELVDVAVKAFSGRRGPAEPDDGLLFALLSHQVLAVRQSMLDFTREIFADLGETVRQQVLETLEFLVRAYRKRHRSDLYAAYRPVPPDQVRQLACYSANLIALRVVLEPDDVSGVPLAELLGVPGPSPAVLTEWRITPLLWQAGLDTDGLRAMLTAIGLDESPPRLFDYRHDLNLMPSELALTRLIGDEVNEKRLTYGLAVLNESHYTEPASWTDMMKTWLIPALAGISGVPFLSMPPEGTPDEEIFEVASLIFKYLRASTSYNLPAYERVLRLLFSMPPVFKMDELALTAAVIGRPGLRDAVPELQNFEIYGRYAQIVRRADRRGSRTEREMTNWKNPPEQVVHALEDVLMKPLSLRKDELSSAAAPLGGATDRGR